MKTALTLAGIALCLLPMAAQAAPAAKKSGKMVTMYQAAKCHMYFTPAQAKKYDYACPISKGKMAKVMVTPAVAKSGEAATNKALEKK